MFVETFLLDSAEWFSNELIQPVVNFSDITIENALFFGMHVEQGLSPDYDTWDGAVPDEWGWDTILNANFNGNLLGGSIQASVDTTTELRIKRRVKGTFKWSTVYVQPIDDVDDFSFEWYDRTAAGKTLYEYACVPVINGSEGAITALEVYSEFSDYFLNGPDNSYHLILNSANDYAYNQETGVQTTIGRKYPFIIKNGNVGYYSGSFEAAVVELKQCEFDFENGVVFRRNFDQFLTDGRAKILKDWLGHIWMVFVVDAISVSRGEHYHAPMHQISWVECGSATDIGDLYDNGFIDTDIDRL